MYPSGACSTGSETPDDCRNEICCGHTGCRSLKKYALCRQWFFARWIPKRPFLPGDLPDRLSIWLRGYQYRYCATFRTPGAYELLLRLDSGAYYGLAWDLLLQDEEVVDRPGDLSGAWALACCSDAHHINAPFWAVCMTHPQEGSFIFGDKQLPNHLLAEVEAIAEHGGV